MTDASPTPAVELPTLKAKDFTTDQDVRWCPGCGDYAVLAAVRKTLPKLGRAKEDYVFVSGIGCAARFPYYMETFGLHSIHGRAPAFATGIKIANPELDVWLVSGDGDLLSIGGNHTIHIMRRNVDVNIILLSHHQYERPSSAERDVNERVHYGDRMGQQAFETALARGESYEEAVKAGERFVADLPEHEFALSGHLVADATVSEVEHRLVPSPRMIVTCEVLMLEEG